MILRFAGVLVLFMVPLFGWGNLAHVQSEPSELLEIPTKKKGEKVAWLSWQPFGPEERPPSFVSLASYRLKPGDTLTGVARQFGVRVETILSYNQVRSPRMLQAGQELSIPSRDGIRLRLSEPRALIEIAQKYQVFPSLILAANNLPSNSWSVAGGLFIPGGRLDPTELRKALGEYFLWPTKGGRISSSFGRRSDPFTGIKSRHSGLDIANYQGAPVLATKDGVVLTTGYNSILGNHIQVDLGQGYKVVYGHLSAILTKPGTRVTAGQLIGKVGSTGYSTGPHLHFAAYRWDRLLNPLSLFG